ncbi:hypothetical protein HY249_01790 [Candidatus Azambacteria bacterium]|nr:hypothetical protein [Candidatus Azambacteria bacterium]
MANNIDCSGFSFIPIGSFFGTLDGRGFTVSNISITGSGFPGVGLFYQTKNATIKNIGLVNANIGNTSQSYVGGLVGYDWGGTNISNSFVSGTVTGYQYVGGLVGWMEYYMTGPTIYTSSINSSFSTADVSGADAVGGLIGYVIGGSTISNSYATGSVVINPSVSSYPVSGGLIGYMNGAIITNSYSIGSVSSFSIGAGGLIGASSFGTVNSSYWDTENSGKTTSAGGTGLTMAQIKTQSSFTGWDFSTIWNIVSGSSPLSNGSSPFLRTTPALSGVWQNTLKACSDIPSCRNYFAPGGFPLLPACFPSVAGVPGGGVMGCENALVPRYIYKYQ